MKNKGITLIALIITIIIMLILVGVTVNVALNGGLFSTTKKAKEKTEHAVIVENMTSIAMAERASNLDYTATEMRIALKEKGIIKEDGITINTEQFIGRQDDNYIISADGTIRYFGEYIGVAELGLNSEEIQLKMPAEACSTENSKVFIGLDLTIKVNEGDVKSKNNSQYEIEAPSIREDGKKFSHWEDDYGNIVSYLAKDTINILNSSIYTPIYIDKDDEVEKKSSVSLGIIACKKGRCSLEIKRNLTDSSNIVECGMILTRNKELATVDNMILDKAIEDKNAEIRIIGRLENMSGDSQQVFFTMGISSVRDRYFRGYVKYINNQGEDCVLYTNIVNFSAENQELSETKAISNKEQVEILK